MNCKDCKHEIRFIGERLDGGPFYRHANWRQGFACPCLRCAP